ncbi:MAG: alpha/beta hydrolase [Pseudomonadota bacterium]|nr:alpha/beta hydrolase [Pseudomonadota bacterium]
MNDLSDYQPRRVARSRFITVRGLRYHVLEWGEPALVTASRPALVMLHGWMDVAASFQFVVDALPSGRHVIALDWRGFGLTDSPPGDTYWIPDYIGDLDVALDMLLPGQTIDLAGHSMGGNAVMLYAGLRPERIRRLVNLEGFGMPRTCPEQAPKRLVQWLDDLKTVHELRSYPTLEAVAARLQKTNPRLRGDRAAWLAQHWSRPRTNADGTPGGREILGDPAHKRPTPLLYHVEEVLEIWKLISAPLLWVEGDQTDIGRWWGNRYTKEEFHQRLAVVPQVERHVLSPAGHMLHHDQPEALAERLESFLADG